MINKTRFKLKKNGEPYSECYCRRPELIENYDLAIADTTQMWEVHHRREELYSQEELKERGEYFDVPPEELIFLTQSEHSKVDSACKRQSKAHKGKKRGPHSEETKRKIGKAHKNRKDLSKKVLCVETGEIFESTMEAQRKTGIDRANISNVCNGRQKTSGGYHWKYV